MTDFYDNEQNVEQYIAMADGYDGRSLVEILRRHVPAGAEVLELGMGPGVDFALLAEHYAVTGSDRSTVFLERMHRRRPEADLLQLDAVSVETDRQFDAIYSNKVLHHLSRADLTRSFQRQAEILRPGGIAIHSFWAGEGEEEMHGLRFAYHTCATLAACIDNNLAILACAAYSEMEDDDSLYLLLRNDDSITSTFAQDRVQ